mgnify:CR=1 FL=1
MNWDIYVTNKDCKSCCHSRVVDVSSDYEAHEWQCSLGHYINGQMEPDKKQCGLSAGEHYVADTTYSIKKTKE